MLTSESNEVYVSMASIWEIAIESSSGEPREEAEDMEAEMQRSGAIPIGIEFSHCKRFETLPDIHRDPFDRKLVAHSEVEPMILLTSNAQLAPFGPHVRVV